MSQRLAGFPSQPADVHTTTFTDTVDAAGIVYAVRFTWRSRTSSWYIDIDDALGLPILRGRRLSPGWALNLAQFEGGPAGGLVCMGRDDFARDDLGGTNLRVVYFTPDEIAALNPTERTDGISRVVAA